jgi:CHASE3 domain sensor protein
MDVFILFLLGAAVWFVASVVTAWLVGRSWENARQRKERHDLKNEVAALRLLLEAERRKQQG